MPRLIEVIDDVEIPVGSEFLALTYPRSGAYYRNGQLYMVNRESGVVFGPMSWTAFFDQSKLAAPTTTSKSLSVDDVKELAALFERLITVRRTRV